MAIYHFVFEMRAVKIQFENKMGYQKLKRANTRTKMIAIGMLGVHVIIYIICRVIIESQTVTN